MTLSDITVIYLGKYDIYCPSNYYHEQPTPHAADVNSKFKIVRDLKYAYYHNERLPLRPIVTSETYYIDDIVVDEKTWDGVFATMSKRIQDATGSKPKYFAVNDTDDTTIIQFIPDDLIGKRADCAYMDGHMYVRIGDYASIYSKSIKKENEDMPKIVDYTYIEHDKVTKIKWSDGSETVVRGSGDDVTQFCGYVCAIAKRAMGNNGKMLAEWDRLVVKPVERAKKAEEKKRLAAEKKAEEERIREEAKAKRMAKNAKYYEEREKRRKQREIETLAEQIAKEYEQDKLYAEAMKLAIEKYKVPCNYFDDDCDCHCNCKEFDVMDEDENNISD